MNKTMINQCSKGHHYIGDKCPYCGGETVNRYEMRPGDCIACGQLCPVGLYACDTPNPIDQDNTLTN